MKSLNVKSIFYRMLHVSFQFWIDTKTGQNSTKSLNKQSFPKDMPCSGQSHCYRSNLFGNKICRLHVKWRWLVYTCIPVHVFCIEKIICLMSAHDGINSVTNFLYFWNNANRYWIFNCWNKRFWIFKIRDTCIEYSLIYFYFFYSSERSLSWVSHKLLL